MTHDKATPRPWTLDSNFPKMIYQEKPKGSVGKTFKIADAELVVRAVNNFDGLLEACQEAEEMLSIDASGASTRFLSALQIARVSIRQAITKATEGR